MKRVVLGGYGVGGGATRGWGHAEGRTPFRELLRPLRALLIAEQEFVAKPSNVHSLHGSDSCRKQLEFIAPRLSARPMPDWAAAMALNQGDKWRSQTRARNHPAAG